MRWIVGIDEVGRGALAGPVTVAAVAMAVDRRGRPLEASFRDLKDSKKLTPLERQRLSGALRRHPQISFATARVYPRSIERLNISKAANRAAERAFIRLVKGAPAAAHGAIFLDGGLFLGDKGRQRAAYKKARTMPKADERVGAVAAASIIAKVSRDRFMERLAKKHPGYGFEKHKGYGTALHRRALHANGPCAAHRLTFIGRQSIMNG